MVNATRFAKAEMPPAAGMPQQPVNIWMNFDRAAFGKRHHLAASPSRTFVLNYGADAGSSYRLYFLDQNAQLRVPKSVCRPRGISEQVTSLMEEKRQQFRWFRRVYSAVRTLAVIRFGRDFLGLEKPGTWPREITNADCWGGYGRAVAGEPAPCANVSCSNAIPVNGVGGLAFPLTAAESAELARMTRF